MSIRANAIRDDVQGNGAQNCNKTLTCCVYNAVVPATNEKILMPCDGVRLYGHLMKDSQRQFTPQINTGINLHKNLSN